MKSKYYVVGETQPGPMYARAATLALKVGKREAPQPDAGAE